MRSTLPTEVPPNFCTRRAIDAALYRWRLSHRGRGLPSAQERELQACTAEALEIPVEAEQPPAALDRYSGLLSIHPQFWDRTLMIRQLRPEVAHICRLISHQNSGMGQQDLQ